MNIANDTAGISDADILLISNILIFMNSPLRLFKAQIFQALMAGADEYATKPITAAALAEKLGLVDLAGGE